MIPPQKPIVVSKYASLGEIRDAAKEDPTSIKEQTFGLIGSDFINQRQYTVDLKATFSTHKITSGNRITKVQTTAHFEFQQGSRPLLTPMSDEYRDLIFKAVDINGKIYQYSLKGVNACKVDLNSGTTWGSQIKTVTLVGTK